MPQGGKHLHTDAHYGDVLQRRLQSAGGRDAAQHNKRARQGAEGWRPADVISAMAPALAAGSPEAPELLAKLVLVAPSGDGGSSDRPLVGEWLRAKLASLDDDARQGEQPGGLLHCTICNASQCLMCFQADSRHLALSRPAQ